MSRIHVPMERNEGRTNYNKQFEDVWTEIRKLWKGISSGQAGNVHDVVFSLGGPIYVSTSGGYYLPFPTGVLTNIYTSLRSAGTSTTTVKVYRNNTSDTIATVNLTGGARQVRTSVNRQPFAGDSDECFVAVTGAGTNAEGLTVQCRFLVL